MYGWGFRSRALSFWRERTLQLGYQQGKQRTVRRIHGFMGRTASPHRGESAMATSKDKSPEQPKPTTPFSISAILSEDVGRKRPHTSNACATGGGSPPGPTISLSQAATLMMSPVASQRSPLGMQGYPLPVSIPFQGSTLVPVPVQMTPQHSLHNSSLSTSPFNASLLSVLGNQPSPRPQEDVFSDSLGMLSTVALYYNEISGMSNGGVSTPVNDKLEAMKITSSSDVFEGSQTLAAESESESVLDLKNRKTNTPYILKRDKRRKRIYTSKTSDLQTDQKPSSEEAAAPHNLGFLSPSSSDKYPLMLQNQLTFSPSIFLSRPERPTVLNSRPEERPSVLTTSEHSSMTAASSSLLASSPNSDGEYTNSFVTSTPIKEKENARTPARWSPSVHQGGARPRSFLREAHESSSSDSEAPAKRPRLIQKTSRARTKLSPLLENACSPIAKSDPPQPSSLLASNFIPTSRTALLSQQPPITSSQILPEITIQDHSIPEDPPNRTSLSSTGSLLNASASSQLHASHGHPYYHQYYPCTSYPPFQQVMPAQWTNSPVSSHWNRTGQIQSVPPWFIFANDKSERKRSRLTEAINRSLSETPAQNPKLPAEWTKYACGQTDDQKTLTEKARTFLQCRPRQLTFDELS